MMSARSGTRAACAAGGGGGTVARAAMITSSSGVASSSSPSLLFASPRSAGRPTTSGSGDAGVDQRPELHHMPGSSARRHSSRMPPVAARRRSPVVAPDITIGRGDEETSFDLMGYLLRQRIVFVSGYIDDKLATRAVGALLALEAIDPEEEIRLYINSPGGQPYSVIGLVDAIRAVKPPVRTVALGAVYSFASLVLAAGDKGKRSAMKNTRIMLTQPMGGSQGDVHQIEATVRELNAIYQLTARYYMSLTGMGADEVEKLTSRDAFLTPEQAQGVGLIDEIVWNRGGRIPPWQGSPTPPAVIRELEDLGALDRLSGGVLGGW